MEFGDKNCLLMISEGILELSNILILLFKEFTNSDSRSIVAMDAKIGLYLENMPLWSTFQKTIVSHSVCLNDLSGTPVTAFKLYI